MGKCKEKCEVYSRVTGYFRPVANWNRGKQEEFKDRRTFKVAGATAAVLACALLAGCGHNAVTYGDGFKVETTINPQEWTLGVCCMYGKILTVCCRENVELEMEGKGSGSGATGGDDTKGGSTGASSDGKLKFRIGKQITGYYVDALKAGAKPEELDRYAGDGGAAAK